MENDKLIFLDLDGVMNSQIFFESRVKEGKEYPFNQIDERCVHLLNYITDETNAKIVLSSSWRHTAFEKKVLQECGVTGTIIGVTPIDKTRLRGVEIYQWISENIEISRSSYKKYVIIDDDSDMLLWQKEHFFKTDPYCGLTPNLAYKVIRFLNRQLNIED